VPVLVGSVRRRYTPIKYAPNYEFSWRADRCWISFRDCKLAYFLCARLRHDVGNLLHTGHDVWSLLHTGHDVSDRLSSLREEKLSLGSLRAHCL
jgi:hypothetical protein